MKRTDFSVIQTMKNLNGEDYQALRRRIMGIEGKCSERYFGQIFEPFQGPIRPSCRRKFKAYDGLNNVFNLAYTVLKWKVYRAVVKAKLEPYLGFLHSEQFGKPSLVCDFMELYRYLVEDFLIQHSASLRKKDFMMKREDYSKKKVGQREYLNHAQTTDLTRKLYQHFGSTAEIERMRMVNVKPLKH